jgi:4-alpha-glucanotransferase
VVEPVVVAWDGQLPDVEVRAPGGRPARVVVELADGARLERAAARASPLPLGVHRLVAEGSDWRAEATVLAAPKVAWTPPPGRERRWGFFLPLYALRTERSRSRGIADVADLGALFDWLARRGGDAVVSLPLLAAQLDDVGGATADYSPYAPVSRRAWNELYADLDDLPGAVAPAAPPDAPTPGPDHLLDYPAVWTWKRQRLAAAATDFFDAGGDRDPAFQRFLEAAPVAARYARFRAVAVRHGADWRAWPERLRRPPAGSGELPPGEGAAAEERFHLYAQWVMERQLAQLAARVEDRGQLLALDLPIGAHPQGFDVWDNQDCFVSDARVGAPADFYFPLGQDWGFPPLHPERSRETGHRYVRACLEHHLRHAGLLRVDHVLGLQRLFWLRSGEVAARGAYVRYPREELFACLTLAAARRGAMVVGENLGTVPVEVNEALNRHGVLGTYVLQFAWEELLEGRFRLPDAGEVATFDTHDMSTFAAVWSGADLADRHSLGLLDDDGLAREQRRRAELRPAVTAWLGLGADADATAVLRGVNGALARSDAPLVVVNVEDCWLESQPQNVPGTTEAVRPNWRHAAAHPLEAWEDQPGVLDAVEALADARPPPAATRVAGGGGR